MFCLYLNPFLNYSYRYLNRHELQKVHQKRQYLKTLLKLTKSTKEERTYARKDLEHLLDGYIFYPISTPSIKEILEHNIITDKNTLKLIVNEMKFPQTFS